MKTLIYNGRIITSDKIIENGSVAFSDGIITSVGDCPLTGYDTKINAYGNYVSPGFVDIHCHGGGGSDFMDGNEDAFDTIVKTHSKFGTTTILATSLACSYAELLKLFNTYKKYTKKQTKGSKLAGIHLEGPYINILQAGAQDPRYIKNPDRSEYETILNASSGLIKRWTAAPELPGAEEFGHFLTSNHIMPSIGHTEATYPDVLNAYNNGFNMMTHFYSSMSSMTRKNGFRVPGAIESGYIIEDMNVELISDGCHLPPEILSMVYRIKGPDHIALITDAMRCAGSESKESILGSLDAGQKVIIEDGVAKMPDRKSFAGSIATADRLVRTAYKKANIPLHEAVKMASETPARLIGLKRSLTPGLAADIIIFDDMVNISRVIINGIEQ